MLRIESKQTDVAPNAPPSRPAEGEGLLFLAVLAGSWAIAIAVGWVVWQMAPL